MVYSEDMLLFRFVSYGVAQKSEIKLLFFSPTTELVNHTDFSKDSVGMNPITLFSKSY